MQRLGQHFLKNQAVVIKIIDAVAPKAGDIIIEIGPGHGELTESLAKMVNKNTRLILIEKDISLSKKLREQFDGKNNIEIHEGDALKILPSIVDSLPPQKYYLVGNIPYYITGKLLRVVSELERKPERTILMVQEEVADRICATPPTMNRLAASVQFWAKTEIITKVPKADFLPPPKIDSAVVLMTTKTIAPSLQPARYYKAVRAIFSQPRKKATATKDRLIFPWK